MIWLKIKDKYKNLYILKDEHDNDYNINLQFLDIEKQPKIGDTICMNEQLLNDSYEGYSTFYTFGNLDNEYGRNNISIHDIDVITLILDNKKIYLKRLYG